MLHKALGPRRRIIPREEIVDARIAPTKRRFRSPRPRRNLHVRRQAQRLVRLVCSIARSFIELQQKLLVSRQKHPVGGVDKLSLVIVVRNQSRFNARIVRQQLHDWIQVEIGVRGVDGEDAAGF